MEYCMRDHCQWIDKLDGKCHVPCMEKALVLSKEDILRNRILCRRLHAKEKVKRMTKKSEERDGQEKAVTAGLGRQENQG